MTDPTRPVRYPGLPRRLGTRLPVLAAVCLAVAAVAAVAAYAKSRATTPVGTGVVVIDTNLGYQGGAAAGTGMVLTSSGEILTNNHVIRGATTIKVVVPGTSRSYTAKVVGYDVSRDVAVLEATGASNLKTVSLASSAARLGQTVTAVGNAGGSGSLVTSTGTITGIARTITVSNDAGGAETLKNLVETNAGLEPGDSGGPLLNAAGKVVGMDTAASVGSGYQNVSSSNGFAIPITRATAIANLIVAGTSSTTVHIGTTAFLGIAAVSTDDVRGYDYSQHGAVVAQVVSGSPADTAGLAVGDLITAINGTAVTSPTTISKIVLAKKPGSTISITYLDTNGTTQTTRATLASGPPQ